MKNFLGRTDGTSRIDFIFKNAVSRVLSRSALVKEYSTLALGFGLAFELAWFWSLSLSLTRARKSEKEKETKRRGTSLHLESIEQRKEIWRLLPLLLSCCVAVWSCRFVIYKDVEYYEKARISCI
jgi:hypothetical protein